MHAYVHMLVAVPPMGAPGTSPAPRGAVGRAAPTRVRGDQSQHLTARSSGQTCAGASAAWGRPAGMTSATRLVHTARLRCGESRLSAWGDAFGQNDPQFSPLMPY